MCDEAEQRRAVRLDLMRSRGVLQDGRLFQETLEHGLRLLQAE